MQMKAAELALSAAWADYVQAIKRPSSNVIYGDPALTLAPPHVDRTMALKLRRGRRGASRAYPTTDELLAFGRECCAVREPMQVIERIAEGMRTTLITAARDERIDRGLWQ